MRARPPAFRIQHRLYHPREFALDGLRHIDVGVQLTGQFRSADWPPLVSIASKRETDQEVHHGGGQKVRFSRTAKQHVATCSLTQVKVTQLGVQQAPLAEDLMVSGFWW